jgi:hypothetical protein
MGEIRKMGVIGSRGVHDVFVLSRLPKAEHSPQLYRLKDRRESEMLLAPTHEEEITALVAADAPSERNLPVRLFQIGECCTFFHCQNPCYEY